MGLGAVEGATIVLADKYQQGLHAKSGNRVGRKTFWLLVGAFCKVRKATACCCKPMRITDHMPQQLLKELFKLVLQCTQPSNRFHTHTHTHTPAHTHTHISHDRYTCLMFQSFFTISIAFVVVLFVVGRSSDDCDGCDGDGGDDP